MRKHNKKEAEEDISCVHDSSLKCVNVCVLSVCPHQLNVLNQGRWYEWYTL